MRIYIDLVTKLPTSDLWERGQVIPNAYAKLGDGDVVEVMFHRSGTPERLPLGHVVTYCAKLLNKFDSDPALVDVQIGDEARPDSDAGFYIIEPDYNTAPLEAAFQSGDSNDSNDVTTVVANGEISWLAPTIGAKPKSSRTFPVTIENDVKKGNEGPPSSGSPLYLTQAESDARYIRDQFFTVEVPLNAAFVDIDISALGLSAPPTHVVYGSQLPDAGADLLLIGGVSVTSASIRVHFAAAAPVAGYKVSILIK